MSALENRAKRLDAQPTASPSPAKAKPEVWSWIRALTEMSADVRTFRRLARLSAEFKVSPEADEGDETVLRPGPLGNLADRGEEETFKSGIDAWLDGGLFVSLFEGLRPYLGGVSSELQLSAQVVLHRLVEWQFPLFVATSKEGDLLEVILGSISALSSTAAPSSSSSVVARKTAMQGHETILATYAIRCDPVLGFEALLSHTPSTPGLTIALLRSAYTPLLLRLPAELVLEDFLPRLAQVTTDALTAPGADVRLAATTMLTKLHARWKGDGMGECHTRIFAALGLDKEGEGKKGGLLDLLMFYFSK